MNEENVNLVDRLSQIKNEISLLKKEEKLIFEKLISKSEFSVGDRVCFKLYPEIKAYVKNIKCNDDGTLFIVLNMAKKDGSESLIAYNLVNITNTELKNLKRNFDYTNNFILFFPSDIEKIENKEIVKTIKEKRKTIKKTVSYYYSINYSGSMKIVKAFSVKDIKEKLGISNDYISKLGNTLFMEKDFDYDLTQPDFDKKNKNHL